MDNQAPSLATGLSNMRTVALRDPPPTLPDLAEAARSADPTRYLNDTDPAKLTLRQLTAIRAAYVQLRKIVFRV